MMVWVSTLTEGVLLFGSLSPLLGCHTRLHEPSIIITFIYHILVRGVYIRTW